MPISLRSTMHSSLALALVASACISEKGGYADPPELPPEAADPPVGPTEDAPKVSDFLDPLPLAPEDADARGWHWIDMTNELTHFNEVRLEKRLGRRPEAGIAVRHKPESPNLLIFLQGGNGCVAEAICENTANANGLSNDWKFADPSVHPWCRLNTYADAETCEDEARPLDQDRRVPVDYHVFTDAESNPFHDWNYVFVPYISGDFMAGDNPDDVMIGGEPRRFRGRANTLAILRRIAPTFRDVERVVVSGYSAGGMGAMFNFPRFVEAFQKVNPDTPDPDISLLVDSAMLTLDRDAPACMQQRMRHVFRVDRGLPADCDGCFAPDGTHSEAYLRWLLDNYGDKHEIGVIVGDGDGVLMALKAAAANDCAKIDYSTQDVGEFVADTLTQRWALRATERRVRSLLCEYEHGSMHIVPEFYSHVWFRSNLLDTDRRKAGAMRQYIGDFLAGQGHASACP